MSCQGVVQEIVNNDLALHKEAKDPICSPGTSS